MEETFAASSPAASPNGRVMVVLTILFLVALACGWRYAPEPVARALFRQESLIRAEGYADRLAGFLDNGAQAFLDGAVTARDINWLQGVAATRDLYRIVLRGPTGRAFWSTHPGDLRLSLAMPEVQATLRRGAIHFAHLHLPDAEVLGSANVVGAGTAATDHLGRDVNHLILPVRWRGQVIGAIETYQDVTALNNSWLETIRWTFGLVAGVIGLLGLAAMLCIRRAGADRLSASRAHAQAETEFLSQQLRQGREVRLLGDLNEWLQSSESLDELFYMVTRFMSHLLPALSGAIYVYSASRDVLDGSCSWNGGTHRTHIHPEDCWGLRRGRTYSNSESEVRFVCAHVPDDDHAKDHICIPFLAHGETVGMMHLTVQDTLAPQTVARHRKLAQMCAEQISLAIANVRMRDELHDQAIRDSLTGLYNRRHVLDMLRRRIDLRKAAPFSVIVIDIDHFKQFNDNHGHDAGDVVLRSVAEVLASACDGLDTAARMGGEELMLLLPDIEPATATARAEALRKAVADLTLRYGDKTLPRVTISIGAAHYPAHGATPQEVIRAADEAMYAAKANGRNGVVSAGDVRPGSLLPRGRSEEGATTAIAAA